MAEPGHALEDLVEVLTGDVWKLEQRVAGGVFNIDRDAAIASLRRQADLDPALACFGHGEPVTADAGVALRAALSRLRG